MWQKLKKKGKPIYALAPLAGITDSAFRQICKEYGADVVYSEMASATALFFNQNNLINNPTLELLEFDKKERPFVVQLFGSNPKHFAVATKIISDKKLISKLPITNYQLPNGLDINFGCPVPKVAKQKAGAELFKDLKLSKEVIKSVIENTDLPVSIKTRTKVGEVDVLRFLDYMKDLDIKAIMIHGRTFAQGFSGPVDYGIIKKARDYFGGIILANGGVYNKQEADELLEKTGADGIGIGQGALGKPWIFEEIKNQSRVLGTKVKSNEEIFKIALRHAELAFELKGEQGVIEMRKHLCWYVQGMDGARKLREKLVKVNSINEIKLIFDLLK
jgi:nifR3 family TIM-barrel protein